MTRHLPAAAILAVLVTAFMCGIAAWVERAFPAASELSPAHGSTLHGIEAAGGETGGGA